MASPREHVEFMRKNTFKIGEEPGPKDVFLHHAINYLSAELYTKDVHFLMELIQNAEDNEYLEGVQPSLEFVITSQDITATGAPATLIIFNNEKGFSPKNIESICALGCSTKKGNRGRGYIGEKGIGFKSVFLITARPYVFSNGYQIRFSEDPCPDCKVGFIVPEWVDENPTLSSVKKIYGSNSQLPTTTFVLPLKPDKVKAVKEQLSSIHPEVLLFLSKLKKLSVKEVNNNPKVSSVGAFFKDLPVPNAPALRGLGGSESFVVHLSADGTSDCYEKECSYYMWRQRFPVREENKVEKRKEVSEWVITLAFPNGERLKRGGNSPGVYAYLPTEMVTNFPFIIQSDFLLPSSRETILLDNQWNKGILNCVPTAFVNAFIALVKTNEDAPLSSLARMFEFLPVNGSPYPEMDVVRDSIKRKLVNENIVPCESYMEQKFFRKPSEVGRLMPGFWNILDKAKQEGVSLKTISSHGRYVLASSFDRQEYDPVLNFLGVVPMGNDWYVDCIRGCNLVSGVSEKLYLEILSFVTEKWSLNFQKTSMNSVLLIKYVDRDGDVCMCSFNDILEKNTQKVLFSANLGRVSWLIDWNREFGCPGKCYFLPKSVQEELLVYPKWRTLLEWFSYELRVKAVNVREYASLISNSIMSSKKLVVAYAHFLYHSESNDYLTTKEANSMLYNMPAIDNYGLLVNEWNGILIPASVSKWVGLVGSNMWRNRGYVELGEDYLQAGKYAGISTSKNELIDLLKSGLGASDVPHIHPPDEVIPTLSAPLTKNNTFLLLEWIRNLERKGIPFPSKFLKSIKEESWMKVSIHGRPGHRPPSLSFFPSSSWGYLLQDVSVLVDIPIIDMSWYGDQINNYTDELKKIGVVFEFKEACDFFWKHVISLVSSSALTRDHVYSILKFIKFLREKFLSPEDFIQSLKEGKWLRTSLGYRSPVGSILYRWEAAMEICDLPLISHDYYGEEILLYKSELQLLGVEVSHDCNHQLVLNHLKSPLQITAQTSPCGLFVLKCLRHIKSPERLIQVFKQKKFLKTNLGYSAPFESYLYNPEWGCFLQVFNTFPIIDDGFYGNNISSYEKELSQLGVVLDYEKSMQAFAGALKQQAEKSSIKKGNVLFLLACLRKLNGTDFKLPRDVSSSIHKAKWLKTRLGDFRSPQECILFGPEWVSIAPISLLPFIDDSVNNYGKKIYEYEKELKSVGVIVCFEKGCKLVASSLHFPDDLSAVTPTNVYALLECIRCLLKSQEDKPLSDSLLKIIAKKWLKTTFGYKSPNECMLRSPKLITLLAQKDGPFIDEEFYGSKIMSYSKELNLIGVTVEIGKGCSLLASQLEFHSELDTIVRIYSYLQKFDWKPEKEVEKKIWVPYGNEGGNWEKPQGSVLWDKDDLFAGQLNVLEKSYDSKLLSFFALAFGVKSHPGIEDYCKLWSGWESSKTRLSQKECCTFWQFVVRSWGLKNEEIIAQNLSKLPVDSGSDWVLLVDKNDVFIADDLLLKDLFQQKSPQLFVWFPKLCSDSPSRFELLKIYSKIGVRKISESVKKDEISSNPGSLLKQVNPSEIFIGKGLVSLILGFLASPSLKIESEKRQAIVNHLLIVTVFESNEPISVSYKLSLLSGEVLETETEVPIRWERKSGKIFATKMDKTLGKKIVIEYATYFSKVISEGLLWENEGWIEPLAELIKMGFLVDFDEEAVEFLLKTKNLELFEEDLKFLSSVLPTD